MRLREYSISVRWTCLEDIIGDGRLADWLNAAAEERQTRWLYREDRLTPSARRVEDAQAFITELSEGGFHQRHRSDLESEDGMLKFYIDAGPHPYTGEWSVRGDLRLIWGEGCGEDDYAVISDRAFTYFRSAVLTLNPIAAHANDVDDTSTQNMEGDGVLRLGYGIEPSSMPPLKDRPGREWNRGSLRLAAEWCAWYSDESVKKLAMSAPDELGERLSGGWLFQLSELCPRDPDREYRERQLRLRASLGLEALAKSSSWALGYWDRRSRQDS